MNLPAQEPNTHHFLPTDGEVVAPRAGAFIEALRDIGYSLESAVADIIDNAVAAEASLIDLRFGWSGAGQPWLAILDDGRGMAPAELVEAMRPGTRSPLEARDATDLGRFGLGLKTASFSQCRRFTVVSRKDGHIAARCWDLDVVSQTDEWRLLKLSPGEVEQLPVYGELPEVGTMVLWEKLDRMDLACGPVLGQALFNEKMAQVREHLALVFHRYLSGEPGIKKITIRMNLLPVKAFDPFNSKNPSTTYLPEERFNVNGAQVVMRPFILPHHSKVKAAEYQEFAGAEGYLRSQGFYVYRNRRLIIHGTWFRMARQEELTKLARVLIDIPNTLDHLWTIDVRKSRAQPPEAVRQRMKALLEKIRESAKRPYTHRGSVIAQRKATPVWRRREFNSRVQYEVNPEHPMLLNFRTDLEEQQRAQLDLLLDMIGAAFPTALLFSDMAGHPEKTDPASIDSTIMEQLARHLRQCFPEETPDDFRMRLRSMEPFASNPGFIDQFVSVLLEAE